MTSQRARPKSRSEFSHRYEQRDRQPSSYTVRVPFAYLLIGSPSAYFPSSAYFALSWLAIRLSARVLLSQAYLRPSSPLAFCCSRYSLHGSPSAFHKKQYLLHSSSDDQRVSRLVSRSHTFQTSFSSSVRTKIAVFREDYQRPANLKD